MVVQGLLVREKICARSALVATDSLPWPVRFMDRKADHVSDASETDTRNVIELFLKYTEDRNFDGHREILAEDCVFTYPYAAEGAPERIEGSDEIIERALVGG